MIKDLPTRLRRWTHDVDAVPASELMDEAAAEIERLRWRVMTLESAAKYSEGRRVTEPLPERASGRGTVTLGVSEAWDTAYAVTRANLVAQQANHDAVPEAKAAISDSHERPLTMRCQQTGESRCAASGSGSGTGNTQEPVAWAVMPANSDYCVTLSARREAAQKAAERKVEVGEYATMDDIVVVPLYRHPQPTLTDAEREAVEWYASFPDGIHVATLRGLLERMR